MRKRLRAFSVGVVALILVNAGRADESTAVKVVEKLGGKVKVDDKLPGKPVVEVDLSNTEVADAGLKELKEFKNLQSFTGRMVTDTGLKELKELKTLKILHLDACDVTDAGVKNLKAALRKLEISR